MEMNAGTTQDGSLTFIDVTAAEDDQRQECPQRRRRLLPQETRILQAIFADNPRPSASARDRLAKTLGISSKTIQIWFQNRRAKTRRDKFLKVTTDFPIQNQSSLHSGMNVAISPMISPYVSFPLTSPISILRTAGSPHSPSSALSLKSMPTMRADGSYLMETPSLPLLNVCSQSFLTPEIPAPAWELGVGLKSESFGSNQLWETSNPNPASHLGDDLFGGIGLWSENPQSYNKQLHEEEKHEPISLAHIVTDNDNRGVPGF